MPMPKRYFKPLSDKESKLSTKEHRMREVDFDVHMKVSMLEGMKPCCGPTGQWQRLLRGALAGKRCSTQSANHFWPLQRQWSITSGCQQRGPTMFNAMPLPFKRTLKSP